MFYMTENDFDMQQEILASVLWDMVNIYDHVRCSPMAMEVFIGGLTRTKLPTTPNRWDIVDSTGSDTTNPFEYANLAAFMCNKLPTKYKTNIKP